MEIVLNPSPFEPGILDWDLGKVSLFLLNEVEGEQMTGAREPGKILDGLLARFPASSVVLTLGEKGAWYADGAQRCFCPARKAQAVDTTAAGDTFSGYFFGGEEQTNGYGKVSSNCSGGGSDRSVPKRRVRIHSDLERDFDIIGALLPSLLMIK